MKELPYKFVNISYRIQNEEKEWLTYGLNMKKGHFIFSEHEMNAWDIKQQEYAFIICYLLSMERNQNGKSSCHVVEGKTTYEQRIIEP